MLPILMVDDSLADAKLVKQFAKRAKIANPIIHMESGAEALEFLAETAELPGFLLLDINMPGMNGHEVLAAIRSSDRPEVARLPVVFLTTSNNPDEIRQAYSESVNSYIVKPVDAAGFQRIITSLAGYWLEIVNLPEPQ